MPSLLDKVAGTDYYNFASACKTGSAAKAYTAQCIAKIDVKLPCFCELYQKYSVKVGASHLF
jgi:hypothetical protein